MQRNMVTYEQWKKNHDRLKELCFQENFTDEYFTCLMVSANFRKNHPVVYERYLNRERYGLSFKENLCSKSLLTTTKLNLQSTEIR